MPRSSKKAVKKKVTRKVTHRFPGIDRALSKAVYALESRLALLQRETGAKNGGGEVVQIFASLSKSAKRTLLQVARGLRKSNS